MIRIVEPLIIVSYVFRWTVTTLTNVNLIVVVIKIFLILLTRKILTDLRTAPSLYKILRVLILFGDVHLLLSLLQLQLRVQSLLLADFLHDRKIPVIDLRWFPVSLKSYGEIRPSLGYLVVFRRFVRFRDRVVRRTGRKLHDVDVAVSMSVSTAVRLVDPRLGAESRRLGTSQTFLMVSIGDLKRRETEPIQDRRVARVNRLEVGHHLLGCDYDDGARKEQQRAAQQSCGRAHAALVFLFE